MPRTGRRPGDSGARTAILDAARLSFAQEGYEGATIRSIAGTARVDPALVHHYFGNKDDLFAAAMEFPFNPAEALVPLLEQGPDGLGERILRLFLSMWDQRAPASPFVAMIRSASSNDQAATMLREFITREVIGRIAHALATDHPELRATLVGSQMVGLGFARYVVRIEPLASANTDTVVICIAPTIQRYLTGDLDLPCNA
ncbi:TetR family transcriptional regulator [soil metagenome]